MCQGQSDHGDGFWGSYVGKAATTPLCDMSILRALRNLPASLSPVSLTYLISDQLSPGRTHILGQVLEWRVAKERSDSLSLVCPGAGPQQDRVLWLEEGPPAPTTQSPAPGPVGTPGIL